MVYNHTNGKVNGGQISGGLNSVGNGINGIQVAGLANVAIDTVRGIQVASLFNVAARKMTGVQVSLFNSAVEMNGLQVGLINTSINSKGYSIGLFNFVWNIVIDPSNIAQEEVYAATFGTIYRSTDGGEISWDQVLGGSLVGVISVSTSAASRA